MKRTFCLALACTLLTILYSCGHGSTTKYNEGSAVMYADEGFKSFMEQEIQVFEYQYPGAFILPKYMGESDAINGLIKDSCTIAVISRPLSKDQMEYIKRGNKKLVRQQEIAVDAVALIVNKDNPVGLLSVQEIKDLFNGKINTWSQLAWNDTTQIKLVFDMEGSANVSYIEDNFLAKGAAFPKNVHAQKSNADVVKLIEQDKSAIGLVSVSWLGDNLERLQTDLHKDQMDTQKLASLQSDNDTLAIDFTDRVKLLKVRKDDSPIGFLPYQAYINSGEYPLFRKVYMVSTASNNSVGHSFFSFVTGFIGQKIIGLTGIMPFMVHQRVVELQ